MYHYTSFFNDKRAYHDKHVTMNNIFHDEYVTFLERKANFPPPLPHYRTPGSPREYQIKTIPLFLIKDSSWGPMFSSSLECRDHREGCKKSKNMADYYHELPIFVYQATVHLFNRIEKWLYRGTKLLVSQRFSLWPMRLRIPTGQTQTSWLLTSKVEKLNSDFRLHVM